MENKNRPVCPGCLNLQVGPSYSMSCCQNEKCIYGPNTLLPGLIKRREAINNLKPDQNITAIEDGITAMRMENQALRDALRVRIENAYCPECGSVMMHWYGPHAKTCRHHTTESKVMQ